MALLNWQKKFETGFTEFDDHHKHLVEILNRVADLAHKPDRVGDLNEVLQELVNYTVYHFKAEEKWMQENNYPDYPKHLKEHEGLLKSVGSYMQRFDKENLTGITDELLTFLKQWLLTHIIASDTKLAKYADSLKAA